MTEKERIEELKSKYENFIKTESGKNWLDEQKERHFHSGFGDYLYDFYPEMLL